MLEPGEDAVGSSRTGRRTSWRCCASWRPIARRRRGTPAGAHYATTGTRARSDVGGRRWYGLVQPHEGDQRIDHLGVELRPGVAVQLREGGLQVERRAVGAALRHRPVGVADGDDPCRQRDPVASEAVRVAQPIRALVVKPHDEGHGLQTGDARDHLSAPLRVHLDEPQLLHGEPARLRQQGGWKAQLADVVKQRAELDLDQLGAGEPKPPADGNRRGGDLERVVVGVAVRLGERLHERANLGLRITGRELAPGVVREGLSGKVAELTEQRHLTRFELSVLVPATDTHRPQLGGASDHRRRGHGVKLWVRQAPPDQVGVDARSGHGRELPRIARTAHDDPRLTEAEDRASMLREPVEHNARIARLLGRRHPCR